LSTPYWTSQSLWSQNETFVTMATMSRDVRNRCREHPQFTNLTTSRRFREPLAVCWIADNNWSNNADIPACQGFNGAGGPAWPKAGW